MRSQISNMKKERTEVYKLKKRALVIGGSGFMGSHTADILSDKGIDVTIADMKKSKWLRADQKMIELDILNLDSVVEAVKNSDYVYHFAAIADIGEAKKNPYKTLEINLVGTMNILEAAVIF